jgi:hypothetical protein
MINPIKPSNKKAVTKSTITKETFDALIVEVYDIMLAYSRSSNDYLHKGRPIEVGNVRFWFEVDKETNAEGLKFDPSVELWNETAMRIDLDRHFHSIYFNNITG